MKQTPQRMFLIKDKQLAMRRVMFVQKFDEHGKMDVPKFRNKRRTTNLPASKKLLGDVSSRED
jgi:hypothetical protein